MAWIYLYVVDSNHRMWLHCKHVIVLQILSYPNAHVMKATHSNDCGLSLMVTNSEKKRQDESYLSQIFNMRIKMPHFQQVVWKYYPLPMASPEKKLTRKHGCEIPLLRYIFLSVVSNKCNKCICNWPLPTEAFQDQCKQIMINKYSVSWLWQGLVHFADPQSMDYPIWTTKWTTLMDSQMDYLDGLPIWTT